MDLGPRVDVQINRRHRRRHEERHPVVLRSNRERVRPDLVRRISVCRDPIGADNDRIDAPSGSERSRRRIGN